MVKSCYPELGALGWKRLVTLRGFTEILILFFSIWINWKRGFNTKNIQQYIYVICISNSERMSNQNLTPEWWHVHATWSSVLLKRFIKCFHLMMKSIFFFFWIFRLKFYFAINLINDVHVAMFYNLGEIQMLGYLD